MTGLTHAGIVVHRVTQGELGTSAYSQRSRFVFTRTFRALRGHGHCVQIMRALAYGLATVILLCCKVGPAQGSNFDWDRRITSNHITLQNIGSNTWRVTACPTFLGITQASSLVNLSTILKVSVNGQPRDSSVTVAYTAPTTTNQPAVHDCCTDSPCPLNSTCTTLADIGQAGCACAVVICGNPISVTAVQGDVIGVSLIPAPSAVPEQYTPNDFAQVVVPAAGPVAPMVKNGPLVAVIIALGLSAAFFLRRRSTDDGQ